MSRFVVHVVHVVPVAIAPLRSRLAHRRVTVGESCAFGVSARRG